MSHCAVLLYHALRQPPKSLGELGRLLFVEPDRFAEQMRSLADHGYRTLTLDEFHTCFTRGQFPERTVLLTFDDGYEHVADIATPVLEGHGFTAVMFAPLSHLGGENAWDASIPNFPVLKIANADQIRLMDSGPWQVASHGFEHSDLCILSNADCLWQLTTARVALEDLLGRKVSELAYPLGSHDAMARQNAQQAGYRLAFAVAQSNRRRDPFQIPRTMVRGDDSQIVFRLKARLGGTAAIEATRKLRWMLRKGPRPDPAQSIHFDSKTPQSAASGSVKA
jgi:peptidoglycan/xylan/chitin deacetylase (PgdA/CDA1 family)